MLADQILKTLKFFDTQQLPLTLIEVWRFLLADDSADTASIPLGRVAQLLDILEQHGQVAPHLGYYCLPGRQLIVSQRLSNYKFGLVREQRIKHHRNWLRRIPFVRAVGLTGSQAFGEQKAESDIDLLVVTDERYLFLARLFITFYFQITGSRRYGKNIANRFCLNHYVAGSFEMSGQSAYTALEYAKLRPVIGAFAIKHFKQKNVSWMKRFFPNAIFGGPNVPYEDSSIAQRIIESIFDNRFGKYLESVAKKYQLGRIKTGDYIRVSDTELAFHPDSKEVALVRSFAEL